MSQYNNRGITMNDLKDQLYSLNMRLLLAMQNHDEAAEEKVRQEIVTVQREIDQMSLRGMGRW